MSGKAGCGSVRGPFGGLVLASRSPLGQSVPAQSPITRSRVAQPPPAVCATSACTAVAAAPTLPAAALAEPPLPASLPPTPGCVWWVQVDPSHQRSRSDAPYGSGYQPEGGKSMRQG